MKSKSLLLILIFLIHLQSVSQSWTPLGTKGFSDGEAYNQQIILMNETPYVA